MAEFGCRSFSQSKRIKNERGFLRDNATILLIVIKIVEFTKEKKEMSSVSKFEKVNYAIGYRERDYFCFLHDNLISSILSSNLLIYINLNIIVN